MATENRLHIYRRLVALVAGAGPDANRSAGLHSFAVCALRRDTGLVELARRRSDLWMHLRALVLGKIVVRLAARSLGRAAMAGTVIAEPSGLTGT